MIEPYVGVYVSAQSALSDIDPAAIAAACAAIEAAAEGFTTSASKVTSIGSDCGPDSLYVGGKTISGNVGAVADTFAAQAAAIVGMVAGLPDAAIAKYNEIQTRYNDEAEAEDKRRIAAAQAEEERRRAAERRAANR